MVQHCPYTGLSLRFVISASCMVCQKLILSAEPVGRTSWSLSPTSPPLRLPLTSIGSGSYLSICSNPAAEWVSKQDGASGFTDSVASLTSRVYRDLKMQTFREHAKVPEPDLATARSYATGTDSRLGGFWGYHC